MNLYLARGVCVPPSEAQGAQFLCFDWDALVSLKKQGLTAAPWDDYRPRDGAVRGIAMEFVWRPSESRCSDDER